MKYFLLFQVVSWWSPQAIQVQGPFDQLSICESVRDDIKANFGVRAVCIPVRQPEPAK